MKKFILISIIALFSGCVSHSKYVPMDTVTYNTPLSSRQQLTPQYVPYPLETLSPYSYPGLTTYGY